MEVSIRDIAAIVAGIKRDSSLAIEITPATNLLTEIGLNSVELTQFFLDISETFHLDIDFSLLTLRDLDSVEALCRFLALQNVT